MGGRFLRRVFSVFILTFTFWSLIQFSTAKISCKDNNGNFVDWFVVYKLPYDKKGSGDVGSGLSFYYMDINHPHWELNRRDINTTGQAVQQTLKQIYNNNKAKDVMYILYNDAAPDKKHSDSFHGHTKGDLAFDQQSGFWLVHSVPHFPPYVRNGYSYPSSGKAKGQTMLCVSYSHDQLNVIGEQLKYNFPSIYDKNFPRIFAKDNPNIVDVLQDKHTKNPKWNHIARLKSLHGSQLFTSFAKYSDFHADLYSALVSPYYQQDLLVRTFLTGRGKRLPSNCTGKYKVKNVEVVKFNAATIKYTNDHSKWAVAQTKPITCIGDINRQESQEKRAGGTVCFDNTQVWKSFKSLITKYEECP